MKKFFTVFGFTVLILLIVPAFLIYAGGSKEREKLKKDLQACQTEKDALKQENPALKATIEELNAKVAGLEAEKADLEAQIAELEAQIEEKDRLIEALSQEGAEVSVVSRTVEQRIQMADAEIVELKQDKANLEDENRELKNDIDRLNRELAEIKAEGVVSQADYEELQSENETLASEKETLASENETLASENETLMSEKEELASQNEDLAQQIQQLQDEKAELEAQLAQVTKEKEQLEAALSFYEGAEGEGKVLMETSFERIQEALSDEIEAGKVKVSMGTLGIVVDIEGEYMFDEGKVIMNPTGKIVLEKIAPLLAELDGYFIGVIGNADSKPIVTPALRKRFGTNWELSAHRGAIVVRYLIEKGTISPSKMVAMGFGEFQPIEDNATPEGRGKNRRIDIVLLSVDMLASSVLGAEIR